MPAGADERQQPPAELAGNEQAPGQTFDFDLASAIGNGNGFATHDDPVLPELIDLSMFRDPNAPDEEAEQEPEVRLEGGEAAWMSSEAWPSPVPEPSDPGRRSGTSQAEDTVFMEPPWLAEDPGRPASDPSGTDWTSPDTPWPGETRHPAELPSWADEPAARFGRPDNREWAEDPWAASREPAENVAPPVDPLPEPWPQPAPGPVATGPMSEYGPEEDLWGKPRRFGRKRQERQQRNAQPETSARNDAGQAPPPPEQRRRGRRVQPEEQHPVQDPWLQAQPPDGDPAAEPDAAWGWNAAPQSDPRAQPAAPPEEELLRGRPRRTEDTWVHQVAQETSYYEQRPVAEARPPEPKPERPGGRVAQPAPDDPWARQHREAEAARTPEREAVEQPRRAPAGARENGELDAWARAHADVDEEDFKPRVFDLQLGDEEPALPEPARKIATRLKIDPTAIKVESGLAYVLVDDEGRPVRS